MDPLLYASIVGDLVAVRSLLRAGADVHAREPTYQSTALFQAAAKGHTAVITELLRAGARTEDKDIHGATALRGASSTWCASCWPRAPTSMRATRTSGRPFYAAADKGHHAVIRVLLHEGGAQVDDKIMGTTALHIACQEGRIEAARALVAARADVHALDESKRTPLHMAARRGRVVVIRMLVHYARGRGWRTRATRARQPCTSPLATATSTQSLP